MRKRHIIVPLLVLGPFLAIGRAFATSSPPSRTYHSLQSLDKAILGFHADKGRYPDAKQLARELQEAEWLDRGNDVRDDWGRPFVYRVPGEHGPYDLYSTGADGIDDRGSNDDISRWAGVNEGFYWKRGWPRGRRVIFGSCLLGVMILAAGFWLRWRFIVPFAGMIVSLGIIIGTGLRGQPEMMVFASLVLICSTVACGFSLCPRHTPRGRLNQPTE
jgi:general secretion pathway protein G